MKKGIFIDFGYEMNYRRKLEMIKDAGFDTVMASFGAGDEIDSVLYARELGLYVSNAHLPFKNINDMWLEGNGGEEMTQNFCRLVTLCGELKVPTAVYHVSSSFEPPPYCETGLNRIKRILSVAEENGVDIAFENLRRLDYLKYVMDNAPSPRAKFCFDCGHHNYLSPDADLFSLYGDRLVAVHLHDNFGDYDWHMLPFDAKVDFERVCRGLALVGYEGPVTLEARANVHSKYENVTPENFLSEAFKRSVVLEEKIEVYRQKVGPILFDALK